MKPKLRYEITVVGPDWYRPGAKVVEVDTPEQAQEIAKAMGREGLIVPTREGFTWEPLAIKQVYAKLL